MKRSIIPSTRALPAILFALFLLAAVTSIGRATSSPLNWPCPTATVINYTGCTVQLNLVTDGVFTPVTVPPCATLFGVSTSGFTLIHGINSLGGTFVHIQKPAPSMPVIPPPCGPVPIPASPGDGWVPRITLGPGLGCCVDVYFFSTTPPSCTIYILPSLGPCVL